MAVAVQARLEVNGLWVEGGSGRGPAVLQGISLAVQPGEMLGVVGEAGAGKSMLGFAIMGLLPLGLRVARGSIKLNGDDLLSKSDNALRVVRGRDLALILSGGRTALNPMETAGTQIKNVIRSHLDLDTATLDRMTIDILNAVGIPDPGRRAHSYPHELSGGMAQRILIAQAMVLSPSVLIADEPTSDLDVTVAAQILDQMKGLIEGKEPSTIILTRDLGIVAKFCDGVAVLHHGLLVEYASVASFFARASHPYSQTLLASAKQARGDQPAPTVEDTSNGPRGYGRKFRNFTPTSDMLCDSDYMQINDMHIVRKL
jgi:ABC-type dipeptide/oligopeptide/nickel transport system ATPase component